MNFKVTKLHRCCQFRERNLIIIVILVVNSFFFFFLVRDYQEDKKNLGITIKLLLQMLLLEWLSDRALNFPCSYQWDYKYV